MSDETISHEPDRKSGGRLRRVAWMTGRVIVALASAAALASAGLARETVQTVQEQVPTSDVFTEEVERSAPPADDGADDYLVVGSDTRTDAKGNPLPERILRQLRTEASDGLNTDTIILLRVPKDGSKGYAISIPRDTYVTIPGYQDDKINAAYGVIKSRTAQKLRNEGKTDRAEIERLSDTAGRSALTQVIHDLMGVRVDHYAEVNLYGFYLLTEAIGGVNVCLNHSTSDPNSGASFRKGVQKISGGSALAFVRQRDGLPRGDLDRIVRQQAFLGAAMQQLLSAGTLTDQTKLNALADAASKSIVVSPGLDIVQLARHLGSMSSGAVEFVTIPVVAVGARNERGQSIITVDKPKVHEFVSGLLGRQAPKFAAQRPLLLNGAVPEKQAERQPATIDGVRCVD